MESVPDLKLDETNLAILEELKLDGRKSFQAIAKKVGVSLNTVRNRYNAMVESKIIHVVTMVDPLKIGYNAYVAIHIAVDAPLLQDAAREIAEFPETVWVVETTGDFSLSIEVMCKDIEHLHAYLNERLHKVPGVRSTQVVFHLKYHKTSPWMVQFRESGAV